jgi:ferredoxin-NADP reductase
MIEKDDPQFFEATVEGVTDFGNDTRHFDLAFEPGQRMNFIPGQFVAVLCPKDGKVIRRAYSIASPPEEDRGLALIVKLVQGGVVTTWFWSLKRGDKIRVHGPFGRFVLPERIDFDVAFVAVGTGIAPFRSMIRHLLPRGFERRIQLLFGTRYESSIPYHEEWLDLAMRYPGFSYVPTISRPSPSWTGERGYVQTKIEKLFPNPQGKRVYICGLTEMIQAVQEACLKQGFRKDQIFSEKYD